MAFSKVGIATRSLLAPPPYIVNVAVEVLKLVEQIVLTPVDLESSKLVAVAFAPLARATTMRECKVPIWDGVTVVEQKQFSNWGFRVYKNLNLGRGMHAREMWKNWLLF